LLAPAALAIESADSSWMNAAVLFLNSAIGGTCSPAHHGVGEVLREGVAVCEGAGGRVDIDHGHG
jgi:hypothetical protein